jgi:hypothetical protein
MIILKRIFKMWNGGGMDWMAQNRDRWRAVVNGLDGSELGKVAG